MKQFAHMAFPYLVPVFIVTGVIVYWGARRIEAGGIVDPKSYPIWFRALFIVATIILAAAAALYLVAKS